MNVCSCSSGLGNLGTPNCVPGFGIGKYKIFTPLIDSTGTRNSIDPSVEITDAFITTKLNETDITKRWYLSPEYENGTSERADAEFEEAESGSSFKIRNGVREENLMFFKKDTVFLSKLAQNECVEFGQFIISDTGSVMGITKGTNGLLYPIAIQGYDPKWMPQTDTGVEKVALKYQWKRSEDDESIRIISAEQFSGDFTLFQGLIDVNGVLDAAAALSFTFTARNAYGSLGNEGLHTGLVLGDLTSLTNLTTAVAMTITSITETPTDGVYDVVYTGSTSAADILQLVASKTLFDYAGVASMKIVY